MTSCLCTFLSTFEPTNVTLIQIPNMLFNCREYHYLLDENEQGRRAAPALLIHDFRRCILNSHRAESRVLSRDSVLKS
jgi:hypothetical protein